jgi:DNA end-binding protein Ku
LKLKGEMLELAEHIIKTKRGEFDPSKFEDRYETALAELVKAKLEGRKITPRKEPKRDGVIDLMAALRESAGMGGKKTASHATAKGKATAKPKATTARRKAS